MVHFPVIMCLIPLKFCDLPPDAGTRRPSPPAADRVPESAGIRGFPHTSLKTKGGVPGRVRGRICVRPGLVRGLAARPRPGIIGGHAMLNGLAH